MRRSRRAMRSGAPATTPTPSTTTATTDVMPNVGRIPKSGALAANWVLISHPIAPRPPTMPRAVPSTPVTALSMTRTPRTARSGSPKANIVASSRTRSSTA